MGSSVGRVRKCQRWKKLMEAAAHFGNATSKEAETWLAPMMAMLVPGQQR
jgi:hypothetical protein